MTDSAPQLLPSELDSAALRLRITAGIFYAAARFTPIPLLDEFLRERVAGWMVRNTLPQTIPSSAIQSLFSPSDGCLKGCLSAMMWIPIKLLFFPIRKLMNLVLAVHWVSRDLAEILLLGRVIDHARQAGIFHEARDAGDLARESQRLRRAFDAAMKDTDTRVLRTLIAAALGPLRDVIMAALRTLRLFRRADADAAPAPNRDDQPVIEASVSRVERLLNQRDIREFLANFDARVLAHLETTSEPQLSPRA